MSKRTSQDLANAIEVPDLNNLEVVDDDTEVFEGSELDSADVTPAGGGDDFMHTDDFRRLFVDFAMADTLVAMRWLDRKWHKVVEKKLTELENEPYGGMIVHGGNDIGRNELFSYTRKEKMNRVTKAVFLLNVTKVGDRVFAHAAILCIDIPEGITTIGDASFAGCISLNDIKFPKSLTSIGQSSFYNCSSLGRVDLLHTNVKKLGQASFCDCISLSEMKVPASLQSYGANAFIGCVNLAPPTINLWVTGAIVDYLRSAQRKALMKRSQSDDVHLYNNKPY
ncbi:hypothetical protein TrVE_jg9306 [Triparma verrucosa]|uniref:Leucine-rich repeat domain-containing protein n=1 Tax=Triparma verrucosa TaxID=1606542 RepID=A0A9W7F9S3_9STRA|nr:hypothetical protein TrVE_jg9306 [Triparma verrucosa]